MDADEVRQAIQRQHDADTPENEVRLMRLVKERGARLERTRGRKPQRYRLVVKNGSMEPVTLADVEEWLAKMQAAGAP